MLFHPHKFTAEERDKAPPADFWDRLGRGPIASAESAGDDREAEKILRNVGTLLVVGIGSTRDACRASRLSDSL